MGWDERETVDEIGLLEEIGCCGCGKEKEWAKMIDSRNITAINFCGISFTINRMRLFWLSMAARSDLWCKSN